MSSAESATTPCLGFTSCCPGTGGNHPPQSRLRPPDPRHPAALAGCVPFEVQLANRNITALSFEERFALLVDAQDAAMLDEALRQRLRRAGMRQTACLEKPAFCPRMIR